MDILQMKNSYQILAPEETAKMKYYESEFIKSRITAGTLLQKNVGQKEKET